MNKRDSHRVSLHGTRPNRDQRKRIVNKRHSHRVTHHASPLNRDQPGADRE